MTKKEAKALIIDALTVNHNLYFEAEDFANEYVNNPKRTIKFDEDKSNQLTCPHCKSHTIIPTHAPFYQYRCLNCTETFNI